MRIVLLKYLREKAVLPNPNGPLSDHMPSAAISSANKEVKDLVNATPSDSRKRGPCQNYKDEEKAQIGKGQRTVESMEILVLQNLWRTFPCAPQSSLISNFTHMCCNK